MTDMKALRILRADAKFMSMEFGAYMELVGEHRGAFPRDILKAYDFYTRGEK